MNNFEKIKAMNIDEFVEKDWTPIQETLNNIYEFKLWIGSEVKE